MLLRSIEAAAFFAHRRPSLVRRWYLQGRFTAACDVRTRAVLVDLREVAEFATTRQVHHRAA